MTFMAITVSTVQASHSAWVLVLRGCMITFIGVTMVPLIIAATGVRIPIIVHYPITATIQDMEHIILEELTRATIGQGQTGRLLWDVV